MPSSLLPPSLYLIALLSGILMGMTTVSFWYFAWLALVPLWLVSINGHKISKKSLIIIALAWGFGYHGLALFWITGIHPMTWMGVSWIFSLLIALFCWLFISLWGAVLVILWSLGMSYWGKAKLKFRHNSAQFKGKSEDNLLLINSVLRIVWGVALWCVLEAIWSRSPLWWTSLCYTQSPHNLAILQLSHLSGPSTITAAIVAVNGAIAEIIFYFKSLKRRKIRHYLLFLIPLSFCLLLHFFGWQIYSSPLNDESQSAIKVGIIQGNIPNEIKLYPEGWEKAIEGYTSGYKQLAGKGVNFILMPETALPFTWEEIAQNSSFYQAISSEKVTALLGLFGKINGSFTNSIFAVTGDGKVFGRYDKVQLVPLGEYIPFENILGKLIDRLSPLNTHLVAGKPSQVFPTPFGRAIAGICYDSAFAEHFRRQAAAGGEFIITASNNAHYSETMPAQHHAQDVMRAIETDRWSARATNTGYSAIVNPKGETIWLSKINQYQLHEGQIYRRRTQTLYVRWGDWLTWVLALLGFASWLGMRLSS